MSYSNVFTFRETARGTDWLNCQSELYASRRIFINQDITSESVYDSIMQLQCLEKIDAEQPIELWINTPGGCVTSGLVLYDYIRGMKTPVTIVVAGIAASMGAIILLSADERLILPHSQVMVHSPLTTFGKGFENPSSITEKLTSLEKTRDELNAIIAERTGLNPEEVTKMTEKDTYLESDEAIEKHFCTGLYSQKG